MNITEVKVRKMPTEGAVKAVVSVTFDNCLVVHDIKVVELRDKTIITMPAQRLPDGTYRDIVHPTNTVLRAQLNEAIFTEIDKQRAIALSEE